ncbi:MAG: hypothetical protein HC794_10635 [Nitrospiraceae bacterium]|nr:hypothetical protein [Nitrospiraceae bacterium]
MARLAAAGLPVPPGICVTTEAYDQSLRLSNFSAPEKWRNACALSGQKRASALADCQARIREIDSSLLSTQWLTELQTLDRPPNQRWAVRSSATNEDAGRTSFAGLYRTHLGLSLSQIDAAIKDLWASLWQDAVVRYTVERIGHQTVPAMAVVIQPMLDARTSGVAYSIHPVTGRSFHVVVNAVPGLAAPLVDGQVTPDQYVVAMGEELSNGVAE